MSTFTIYIFWMRRFFCHFMNSRKSLDDSTKKNVFRSASKGLFEGSLTGHRSTLVEVREFCVQAPTDPVAVSGALGESVGVSALMMRFHIYIWRRSHVFWGCFLKDWEARTLTGLVQKKAWTIKLKLEKNGREPLGFRGIWDLLILYIFFSKRWYSRRRKSRIRSLVHKEQIPLWKIHLQILDAVAWISTVNWFTKCWCCTWTVLVSGRANFFSFFSIRIPCIPPPSFRWKKNHISPYFSPQSKRKVGLKRIFFWDINLFDFFNAKCSTKGGLLHCDKMSGSSVCGFFCEESLRVDIFLS